MSNTNKNPAPTAIDDRASKLVKVRNANKQNTTPNTKARQRHVLNAAVEPATAGGSHHGKK